MSTFFNDVVTDLDNLQEDILGPNYEYWKWIKSPKELGMSSDGSLSALGNDIIGLVDYMETLIASGGAQRNPGGNLPLGDRFFFKTGAQCADVKTGENATRYLFIDNIPNGDIPFISGALGTNFGAFEGIIPGVMQSTANINPLQIFQAFMEGTDPSCAVVTLQTRDNQNNLSTESRHVTLTDIKNIEPCMWKNSTNPVSGASRQGCGALSPKSGTCTGCTKEGFTNQNQTTNMADEIDICNKRISQIFKLSLLLLAILVAYKILNKKK